MEIVDPTTLVGGVTRLSPFSNHARPELPDHESELILAEAERAVVTRLVETGLGALEARRIAITLMNRSIRDDLRTMLDLTPTR